MRPEYYDYTYDMFIASADGEQSEAARFSDWIDDATRDGVYAFETAREEAQQPFVRARRPDGTALELLNFSSYNYLGYATHPDVIAAAKDALDRYGLGAASSPVQAGTNLLHTGLEQKLIDVIGLPDRGVSLFSSGYAVNTGTISAVMKRRHHIVIDKSAHMSILEGAQLARSKVHYFEHNDAAHLKQILDELAPTKQRTLVVTEGVFSADGDFGKLSEIVPLAKSYGAQVLVDEAHSFLMCGTRGRGAAAMMGVLDQVDYLVVTFSKALAGLGGALIAKKEIARYVNWYARCRMFSCALDPAMTAGVTKALELASSSDGNDRRAHVDRNATLLRAQLAPDVDIGRSNSWIVPVIYGPETNTIPLADWLQRHGLDGSCMSFPAVPVNEARIRLFVTSQHTEAQITSCARIVRGAADAIGFRKVVS
ncbi:MAG: pyridoxal phosphate-dependent aminotransferase family protein [Kofleriaceae bacterium]